MNPVSPAEVQVPQLVDIIDFKWLMAHEGHHVHVERLQREPAYADACLARAAASSSEALRGAARRLAAARGVSKPAVQVSGA